MAASKRSQNDWYSTWFPVNFFKTSFGNFTVWVIFIVRSPLLPDFFAEFRLPAEQIDSFSYSLPLLDETAAVAVFQSSARSIVPSPFRSLHLPLD